MTDWLGLYDRMTLVPACKKTHDHGFLWRGVGIARARLCADCQIIHVDICDRHSQRSVVDVLVIGYSCRVPCAGQRAPMCRPSGFHVPASGLPCAGQRASICQPAGFHMRASENIRSTGHGAPVPAHEKTDPLHSGPVRT